MFAINAVTVSDKMGFMSLCGMSSEKCVLKNVRIQLVLSSACGSDRIEVGLNHKVGHVVREDTSALHQARDQILFLEVEFLQGGEQQRQVVRADFHIADEFEALQHRQQWAWHGRIGDGHSVLHGQTKAFHLQIEYGEWISI